MPIGVASPSSRSPEIRRHTIRGASNTVVERISVPAGAYIITVSCTMTLSYTFPEGTGSTVYTLMLRLGDFHQEVSGRLSTFVDGSTGVNEYQPAAITLGAEVDERSYIELSGSLSTNGTEAYMYDPSITAIQLDSLHFSRMPGISISMLAPIRRLFGR